MTMSQYQLLKLVANTRAGRISDVANFLRVTNAAASKAVERLVRRDLVVRKPSTNDRRVNYLMLTRHGESVLDRHEKAHDDVLQEIFTAVPVEELTRASELLDRMSVEIHKHSAASDDLCFRCGIYFREKCLLRELTGRGCYYHIRRQTDG